MKVTSGFFSWGLSLFVGLPLLVDGKDHLRGLSSGTGANSNGVCTSSPLFWSQDPWLPVEDKDDGANRTSIPALTQPFYNEVNDVHATVSAANTKLILSVNGNWYPALARLMKEVYIPKNSSYETSYLYTTSPPIGNPQTDNNILKVGNLLFKDAAPHFYTGAPPILNLLGDKIDNSTREFFLYFYVRQCHFEAHG